jgi:hypothetical protein
MEETQADHPNDDKPAPPATETSSLPPIYAQFIGPREPMGMGLYGADGNILAAFLKQPGGGYLRRYNGGGTLPDASGGIVVGRRRIVRPAQMERREHMSPGERRLLAARIWAAEVVERIPDSLPDLSHLTLDETRDAITAFGACNLMICIAGQAVLRRHGLLPP